MPDAMRAAPKDGPTNNDRDRTPSPRQITRARLAVLERGHCVERLVSAVARFEELDQARPVTEDAAHGRDLLAAAVLEAYREYVRADRALSAAIAEVALLDLDPDCRPIVVRCAGVVPYLAHGLDLRDHQHPPRPGAERPDTTPFDRPALGAYLDADRHRPRGQRDDTR